MSWSNGARPQRRSEATDEDHGKPPLAYRLTEHSVYARVLPATRRESNGEAPNAEHPTRGSSWRAQRFSLPVRRRWARFCGVLASRTPLVGAEADDRLTRQPRHLGRSPTATSRSPMALAPSRAPPCGSTTTRTTSPRAVKAFEDKYESRSRSRRSTTPTRRWPSSRADDEFDIYIPSYDRIGKLVDGGLLRPLNHDYIPNIENVGRSSPTPGTTRSGATRVPYTIYTTGIGWRTDQVTEDIGACANP